MGEFKVSKCKGCGATIIWAKLPNGGAVPLDPKAPVYRLTPAGDAIRVNGKNTGPLMVEEGGVVCLVTHFATCPKASQFSGGSRG